MVDDQRIMKTIGERSGVSPVLLAVEINKGSSFVPEIGEWYQDSHKQASRMFPLSMFLDAISSWLSADRSSTVFL